MEFIDILTTKQSMVAGGCLAIIVALYIAKRLFLVRLRAQMKQQGSENHHFYQVLILALNAPLNLTILTILLWLVRYGVTITGALPKCRFARCFRSGMISATKLSGSPFSAVSVEPRSR